ncbi:MAG: dihydrolipoyl dehydrogenase [Ignavibacteria bacterium]|jgi:dihydrolipoamide dehydrogenase|nr:dihydrolipoyl dehydrogenase [Ignavibacteria bacterium]MCU7504380.1 dihydrolipoyl dehydrogenase [Ignavibacteria bacterium]MCU7517603.1 dihydrolipoyl dehydrogenase [Ignavibacteria bacterium]
MANKTQLAVLGGGPGGYAAAFLAADLGMQVTLIDMEKNPGGVCLYRGCIPSKALLHVAKLINETKHSANWGIEFDSPRINLDKLRSWKESVVGKLTGGLGVLSKQRKITYLQGRATILNPTTLEIEKMEGGKEELTFEHLIVCTGSRPAQIPSLMLDSPRVIDSTGALALKDIPKNMLVVGGGYIGLELGSVYASLGTEVSVVEMTPGLLPGADRDMVNILARSLQPVMKSIMLSTKVVKMEDVGNGVKVTFEGEGVQEKEQVFEKVLVSIGRTPNSKGFGLENTKVEVERGFIKVNAQMQTAEPTIYAIGDVVGNPMLAHKASAEGRVAAEVIAGHNVEFHPAAIPAVIFTDPEVAWCGLTETEAREKGIEIKVARFPWAASGRATTLDRSDGSTKLIMDPKTERILGVGIVGPGAGEMIAEGVLAVEMAAVAKDVALSIHPHPTLSETVMESAEVFFGQSTHLYRPKRG